MIVGQVAMHGLATRPSFSEFRNSMFLFPAPVPVFLLQA